MSSSKAIVPARQLILAGVIAFGVPAVSANVPTSNRDDLKVTMRVLEPDAVEPDQIIRKIPPAKPKRRGASGDNPTNDLADPTGNNEPDETGTPADPATPGDPGTAPGTPVDPGSQDDRGGGHGPGRDPDPRDRGEEFGDQVSDDARNHGEDARQHPKPPRDEPRGPPDNPGHDNDRGPGNDHDRGPGHGPRRDPPHDPKPHDPKPH
jgi:hypothetical protein